ncbi:MAG: amidohydrolase [Chloroflexi bacterium]|nr:amidohydrolase [Chloroflexota bacterium]
MYIDCHAHLIPREFALGPRPQAMFAVEPLLAQQEEAGVVTVFSNPMFTYHPDKLDPTDIKHLRIYNDFAANLAAKYPGRLIGTASANPFGGKEYVRETERAIKECGLKGVMVNSSVHGEYLDSDRALPFYELVCELDVPVFVHPPAMPLGTEKMEKYRLIEMIGRPMDTTLSLARAVYAGIFERFPNLKIVGSHVGGGIMMLPGRLNYGWDAREDRDFLPLGQWGENILVQQPSEYMKQLYVDTMSLHPPAVMCAIAMVGVDHVVYGSDAPPLEIPMATSKKVVEDLPLSQSDKNKIASGNAQRILKLDIT